MKAEEPNEEIVIVDRRVNNNNNKKEANTMATNETTCPKCFGTGKYNVPLKDGSIGKCFACKGTGIKAINTNPMSEAQIKFIRNLFAEAKEFMTEDEQKNLIEKMRKHISGEQQQTISWASAAIDKLKQINRDNAY